MKQYKVFFISGRDITLTEAEWILFLAAMQEDLPNIDIRGFDNKTIDFTFFANTKNIECIISEKIEPSATITPPSPAQLRQDQQQAEANRPVTLDDQLANPEVGQ